MSSATEKLADLVDRLQERTDDDRVSWQETDLPGEFAATLDRGSVALHGEETSVGLTVRNDKGQNLERLVLPLESPSFASIISGDDPAKARLRKSLPALYEQVRRRVMQVDETIDSLLDQLK